MSVRDIKGVRLKSKINNYLGDVFNSQVIQNSFTHTHIIILVPA